MRAIVIILDGVGIGNAPDADKYGDFGAATLQHIAEKLGGIFWRNLWALGISNAVPIEGMSPNRTPLAAHGRLTEISSGKDSTSGHWELAGLVVEKPFPTYPHGFPAEIITRFEEAIGRKTLFNAAASGTEIIDRLGDEHVRTTYPIVYTSADSVFQIAAHEKIVPLETLYEWCRIARNILDGEHAVARVIARPFDGESGNYFRTPHRHDFSLPPNGKTVLRIALEANLPVVALGKIFDLYAGDGITEHHVTESNEQGIELLIEHISKSRNGLLLVNLVDFDMKFGHRRDTVGFAKALRVFDDALPRITNAMNSDDVLFITADHGNDPTHSGSDHTRERVPLLIYGERVNPINFGTRATFADMGATIATVLGIDLPAHGVPIAILK